MLSPSDIEGIKERIVAYKALPISDSTFEPFCRMVDKLVDKDIPALLQHEKELRGLLKKIHDIAEQATYSPKEQWTVDSLRDVLMDIRHHSLSL